MKHRIMILFSVICIGCILLLGSCIIKNNQPDDNGLNPPGDNDGDNIGTPTVYTAGYAGNGMAAKACYWVNDVKIDLIGDGVSDHESYANSIYVYNGSVHVAGVYRTDTTDVAVYWVNGVKQPDLLGTGYFSNAYSIFVSDGKVYIAGTYHPGPGTKRIACYWVDGILQPDLSDGSVSASATSIFVSEGKVYIAGFQYDFDDPTMRGFYWVDGVQYVIGDYCQPWSIAVSGGTVYTAGLFGPPGPNNDKGSYWTNSTRNELQGIPKHSVIANSIYVSEGKVYVAGRLSDGDHWTAACYWVDGVRQPDVLSRQHPEIVLPVANSIYVSDGVVYIAGQYSDVSIGGGYYAYVWTNGVKTDLPNPNSSYAEAYSIFVP